MSNSDVIIEEIISELKRENNVEEIEPNVLAKAVSKKIRQLINENKLNSAYDLTKMFPEDSVIQSQRMTICCRRMKHYKTPEYKKQELYEEMKNIAKKFQNYAPIQSQMISVHLERKENNEARDICERPEFQDNERIQSHYVNMLIKEGMTNKHRIRDIGKQFKDSEHIQGQMVLMLLKEGKIDKVREIINRFPDNPFIQCQAIKIAAEERNYKWVEEIAKRFPDNPFVQDVTKKIMAQEEAQNYVDSKRRKEMERIKTILIRIKEGNLKEITEKLEIEDKKVEFILTCAICEKYNMEKTALSAIGSNLKSNEEKDTPYLSGLLNLREHFRQKRKFFDVMYYADLIGKVRYNINYIKPQEMMENNGIEEK